jgi:hypothetical protein
MVPFGLIGVGSSMSQSAVLILLLGIAALIALVVYLRRRNRSGRSATPWSSASGGSPPAATWGPPSAAAAAAAPASVATGPALSISVNLVQPAGDTLLVTWNAVNKGSSPLRIQWGAPRIELSGGELRLLYAWLPDAQPSDAGFELPSSRLAQPGEIISRSTNLTRAAVGRDFAGLRLTVAVGYGPAESYPAAPVTREAYQLWQQVAVSDQRAVR